MKRKWGFSSLRWAALPPCVFDLEGLMLTLVFPVRRVTPTVPALALAKWLKSEAFVPTRRCSARVPQAAVSATVTGEPPRDTAMARRPQREGTMATAATEAATAVASAPPAPVPTAGDQAVVDVADDDAPPPGWGQWGN
jgi:hypothetical protein